MSRLNLVFTGMLVLGSLPATLMEAAAEPQKPVLSEKELEKRCGAAMRDLRMYCSAVVRPQRSSPLIEFFDLVPAQQQAPRPPNPGSQRPELPPTDGSFDCLNARLRVDQYCFRKEPESGEKVASG